MILVGAGIILFISLIVMSVALSRAGQRLVQHTNEILSQAKGLLTDMVDAETGERGYVITGRTEFLEPWERARTDAPQRLARLKALTMDNPEQQRRLGQMEVLVGDKINFIVNVLRARRAGEEVRIDKSLMDRLRATETEFEMAEEAILSRRKATLGIWYGLIIATACLFGAGSGIAIWVALRRYQESERRLREAEALAQQAQRMETIGQLSGGVAHDFNNLLQAAGMHLELALRRMQPDQRETAFVRTAQQALERGARLTDNLLAYARKQPLRPQAVLVDRVLTEVSELLRVTLGGNYAIEVICAVGLWHAKIDPQLLQNALINLVLNARDAMPDGGRITIEAANVALDAAYAQHEIEVAPGDYVMVAVSDTGTGVAPEVLAKLFQPFVTTKREGIGLGLPMVYGFIKQSHGHVKVYSEPNQGTTIKLYLPRTVADAAVQPKEILATPDGDGLTILVVEDEDSVRDGVAEQLRDRGYVVISAADGQAALDILHAGQHIDLLFTDIVLGAGMNGRELADRANALRPKLRVLYTSGYTENAIVHHGTLDAGAVLLSKPYRSDELIQAIDKLLV